MRRHSAALPGHEILGAKNRIGRRRDRAGSVHTLLALRPRDPGYHRSCIDVLVVLGPHFIPAPYSRPLSKIAIVDQVDHYHGHRCAGQADGYVLEHGIIGAVALRRQL